jgi:riboflavin kinase/FMN adenylyltransferase
MIVVLGAFDGFHRGHALLLDRARELSGRHSSSAANGEWAVVTFSPHPDSVVRGGMFSLFSEEERDLLVRFFNVPHIEKIPFDETLSRTSAEGFIALLESLLPVTGVIVGEDFRFGRDREGDAAYLREVARRKGWLFDKLDSFVLEGAKVGSSSIKKHVISGDVDRARNLLGYPFFFRGRVVSGDGRGRTLGFPTANVEYPEKKILPQGGVYAASVLIGNEWWPGALNIGFNPTFLSSVENPRFETYVLDLNESLYGRTITVFLESLLRPEIKFESSDALLHQMQLDVLRVRDCFREKHARHGDVYCHLSKAFS